MTYRETVINSKLQFDKPMSRELITPSKKKKKRKFVLCHQVYRNRLKFKQIKSLNTEFSQPIKLLVTNLIRKLS